MGNRPESVTACRLTGRGDPEFRNEPHSRNCEGPAGAPRTVSHVRYVRYRPTRQGDEVLLTRISSLSCNAKTNGVFMPWDPLKAVTAVAVKGAARFTVRVADAVGGVGGEWFAV